MRDFHLPGRSEVFATNGMCATSHPLASKVAIDILQAGGNAVDAAIAGAALLGVCEPQMCGIGGDCFVLIKPAGQEQVIALNGSGRAPARLQAQSLRDRGLTAVPIGSVDAVTIPGAIDAFCTLSKDWGCAGLEASLAPAIHYAQEGVPVAPRVASDWAGSVDLLQGDARRFYLLDGQAPKVGQVFRAPKMAEVFQKVATQGRAGFYEGAVGEDMQPSLQAMGGSHQMDDFAATKCSYDTPLSGAYHGIELIEHPPNGQGATAILLLNILSHFDIASMEPFGATRVHIEAEATKLAYDARNRFVSDKTHMQRLDYMLSPETAKKLAALINTQKAMGAPAALTESVHRDTIYITVIDKDQMMASLIYSVFHSFGSGLASAEFGINFQNRGAGFTLEAGHPNELGPNKRPMHTIIPGMLRKNGKVTTAFGVMGGSYQSTGHSRFVSNLVDFGMDAQAAIDGPRAFSDHDGLRLERGYSSRVADELSNLGHKVIAPPEAIGGAQSIQVIEDGVLCGASDPRKDGCALGY
jgi:gamma-glutamyltranspeptidase/glutathione hydrolase